ncbi:MAG: CDP-diacylglycerol--serine O-phosphatidyltransferase [Bacteroidota bacterium]
MKQIPNAITSLNLVCGCLSIIAALKGELTQASLFIGAAAVLDFFDGFAARLLKVSGEMGKQLDSLADVVSFGVAPGFIFYRISGTCFGPGFCINQYLFLLIPVFSAIRLARFNIDTRQSDSFIGVPTPANAIFIASLPFILQHDAYGLSSIITHQWFVIIFPFLSAYMLVAELPLLALKFKNFSWASNQYRFILIICCVLSMLIFKFAGIALSIILYIIISIINNLTAKKRYEV